MKKVLLNIAKGIGIATGSLLLLMFLWPILFPGTAAEQIKQWTNTHIDGRLDFSSARLSFFQHFPALTLTLHDFSLTGAAPFQQDTLLAGKALSFGLDLRSLFRESLEVNTFYVDDARINVQVDETGQANYNIYKGSDAPDAPADSSNTHLKVDGIFINRCHLTYHDRSLPMLIEAKDFYYAGRGDLAHSQFDLQSDMRASSFDFIYDGAAYFLRRRLKADLVTGINTASLVFRFAKNNLLINQLPVEFSGDMAILRDGYDIDINVVSGTTDFGNIFSVLPPEYDQWFADTHFSGLSQIVVALKGQYRASPAQAPDLAVNLWVHDGLIQHKLAPAPLQHLWIHSTIRLPGLNSDSLTLAVDTLQFEMNGAPTRAAIFVRGLDQPYLKTDIRSQLDLALLDSALALPNIDLRGQLNLQLQADGYYRTATRTGKAGPDTIITSIPAYHLEAGLQRGYLRDYTQEIPLDELTVRLRSDCATANWQDISLSFDTLHAAIGTGRIGGRLAVKGINPSTVTAQLIANLQLEDLARAFPVKDYVFSGALRADLKAEGTLDIAQQRYPAIDGMVHWQNGFLQTPYYPHPIEQIQIDARIQAASADYRDLAVHIKPVSFVFEQKPFALDADLQNPADWRYRLRADGTLDLGRIYQVFAVEGYQVSGLLQANFDVQGTESDAIAGRYDRLRQKGTLRLKNVELRSADYPDPFFVSGSTLRFDQDKAWLSDAVLRYRKNEFTLNGYAQNFIGHLLGGSTLLGRLSVRCPRLVVDDFTALAPPARAAEPAKGAHATGVVLLPTDMDLALEAAIQEIVYGQTQLQNFSGKVALQHGKLLLEQAQFNIAGATIGFEGSYTPVNARKALFTFGARADSFDVQRAYREIPMFRDMASAAEKASGLVSLDYQLQGRLNDRMEPVYPSLKGQGTVKLEHIQVKGLKLFGAVSKATGKDDINDPELKAVIMKSSIANNIITIERTKMKVLGFRPRIEGQTSLDGRLNLRFRLGLPPFGVLGIPMTITGTSEAPVVEIRKGKDADELDEDVDEEEKPDGGG